MMIVIRPKLKAAEATLLKEEARRFFLQNSRRRVFRVGDDAGVWFVVNKSRIDADIDIHAESAQ